jgi:NTP pyrophosphatase (non-canonical NTP hydrolase)
MPTPEFQNKVALFVQEQQLEMAVAHRLLDLVSEVGELAKEVLIGSRYEQCQFAPKQGWHEELSDVFFSLICLANSTQVNLEEGLNTVLEKYQQRIVRKGDAGSDPNSQANKARGGLS